MNLKHWLESIPEDRVRDGQQFIEHAKQTALAKQRDVYVFIPARGPMWFQYEAPKAHERQHTHVVTPGGTVRFE